MAKCDYCGSTILFGGKASDGRRFCNVRCAHRGALLSIAQQIPETTVQQQVWSVHQGRCPLCSGPGPVDVHVSHRVWSAIALTSWRSQPRISCRACGVKSQGGDAVFSLFLGWWGFPWGLVMTPIQIGRDIAAITRGPDPAKPSEQLQKMVRMTLAAQAAAVAPVAKKNSPALDPVTASHPN
jgi:DNA-directed RNA polymerase subunit RPC12/RpoP